MGFSVRAATVGRQSQESVRRGHPTSYRSKPRPVSEDGLAAAFARAISPAGAKAQRYDASGGNTAEKGLFSIVQASSSPFFVPVARDVLAVDSDKPELLDRALKLADELRAAGLRPVVCDSGPGAGRVHLFALIDDHAERERWERRAQLLGFDPRSDIRPPFSLHRDRKSRSIPRDLDPQVALAMLTPRRKRRKPSGKIWELLKKGAHPEYRKADGTLDRSRAMHAIMVAFVAAGWRFATIRGLLKRSPVFSKLAGRGDADKIMRSSFDRAVRRVESDDATRCPPDVQEAVARERARASAARWPGTGGGSRFALLHALYEVATLAGHSSFTASVRQLADAAGVGVAAASRGLDRLVQDGWIVRIPTPRSRTTRWELPRNAPNRNTTTHSPLSPSGTEVVFHLGAFSQDAARFRGVGKQRVRVLLIVGAGATTVREIAAELRIREAGARKHVAVLIDLGLLVRLPHRQLGLGDVKLHAVAEQLGVAGVGALQRSRHEGERELRRDRFRESKGQKPKNVPHGVKPYVIRRNDVPARPRGRETVPPVRGPARYGGVRAGAA